LPFRRRELERHGACAARIVAFGDDLWLDVMMLGDGNPLPLATPTSLKFTSRLGGMIPVGLLTIC